MATAAGDEHETAEKWLRQRIGQAPKTAIGWFRAGVGFYNKRRFELAIDSFQQSVRLDPLNVRSPCSQWHPIAIGHGD
jgi:cytochrome c-type biogenesis protein CcmH/NrfG